MSVSPKEGSPAPPSNAPPSSLAALLAESYQEVESLRRELVQVKKRAEKAERLASSLQALQTVSNSPNGTQTPFPESATRILMEFEDRAVRAEVARDEAEARKRVLMDTWTQLESYLTAISDAAADARAGYGRIVFEGGGQLVLGQIPTLPGVAAGTMPPPPVKQRVPSSGASGILGTPVFAPASLSHMQPSPAAGSRRQRSPSMDGYHQPPPKKSRGDDRYLGDAPYPPQQDYHYPDPHLPQHTYPPPPPRAVYRSHSQPQPQSHHPPSHQSPLPPPPPQPQSQARMILPPQQHQHRRHSPSPHRTRNSRSRSSSSDTSMSVDEMLLQATGTGPADENGSAHAHAHGMNGNSTSNGNGHGVGRTSNSRQKNTNRRSFGYSHPQVRSHAHGYSDSNPHSHPHAPSYSNPPPSSNSYPHPHPQYQHVQYPQYQHTNQPGYPPPLSRQSSYRKIGEVPANPNGNTEFQTHIFAPPVTGAPTKKSKYAELLPGQNPAFGPMPGAIAGIPGVGGIPYPPVNEHGQRICRQCGVPGRYKDGKCVEKWGPGPLGPGTVCDRCRKKMKRVERRGTMDTQQLPGSSVTPTLQPGQHLQGQGYPNPHHHPNSNSSSRDQTQSQSQSQPAQHPSSSHSSAPISAPTPASAGPSAAPSPSSSSSLKPPTVSPEYTYATPPPPPKSLRSRVVSLGSPPPVIEALRDEGENEGEGEGECEGEDEVVDEVVEGGEGERSIEEAAKNGKHGRSAGTTKNGGGVSRSSSRSAGARGKMKGKGKGKGTETLSVPAEVNGRRSVRNSKSPLNMVVDAQAEDVEESVDAATMKKEEEERGRGKVRGGIRARTAFGWDNEAEVVSAAGSTPSDGGNRSREDSAMDVDVGAGVEAKAHVKGESGDAEAEAEVDLLAAVDAAAEANAA